MEARPPPSPAARLANLEYKYYTEFQSHEPEFDYLKSLEIEEKINQACAGLHCGLNAYPSLPDAGHNIKLSLALPNISPM